MKNKLCFFLLCIVLSSCASNKSTSFAVDYEKEHKPKQKFDFNNNEALDLCYKGWFLVNELNDTFFMRNLTHKMSNDELESLYNQKINDALTYFSQSNEIEKNSENFNGTAEIYKIKKTRVGFNEVSYYSNLETQNYLESYKIKQNSNVYSKIVTSISNLSNEDKLSIYDELLSISKDQTQIADFHFNKGLIYSSKQEYSKSLSEIETAIVLSNTFENLDRYFTGLYDLYEKDKSINIQKFINDSIKNEKDNNKIAFFEYEQGKNYQYILDDYVKAYNQYILAKKKASDEKLIQSIDSQLSDIKQNYKYSCDDKLKKLIVAKKAGFNSYEDYQAYLRRVNFEILYRSLNIGNDTFYLPGDIIVAPSQRLSITDVEQSKAGYVYLVTGYGQNQLSKCCMIVSDYQLQYVAYYGEGLITEKLCLAYQGKSTYKRGYTIVDCDVFTVINPFSPILEDLSTRINEAVKYEKWDFDYSLGELTGEEYELLLKNNYCVALYPDGYQKLSSSCTGEIIDKSNNNEKINYNSWKKVFDAVLNSSFEISQKDYEWLCEAFNSSDEFNSYLEKCIDKTTYNPKWFHDSYISKNKNFNTYMTHLKDASIYTEEFFHYFTWYGIKDEKIIKGLIKKGLNVSMINTSNCDMIFEYIGNLPPNILQIYIDNGLDINMQIPIFDNRTLLSAMRYVWYDEEKWGTEHTVRKDIIDCLLKNGAKE